MIRTIDLRFHDRYRNEDGEWETDDEVSGVSVQFFERSVHSSLYIEVFDWIGKKPLNATGYLDREHAEKLRDFLIDVLRDE